MPSINDLMIKVIEKEMSHVDEFKLTVIVSMLRMISKVCSHNHLFITASNRKESIHQLNK